MAKKKIDLWADHTPVNQEPKASAGADEVFDITGKSTKKTKSSKGKKEPKKTMSLEEKQIAKEHKILKNPLTKVEGSNSTDGPDISVAVSAALSKAIHENYEIDKLGQILDVVIDSVEDPDLSNDSLRRKNFGLVPLFLVIASIVAAIIIIPVVMLLGLSIEKISSSTRASTYVGYETVNASMDSTVDGTKFSLKLANSDSKYITVVEDADTITGYSLSLVDTSTEDDDWANNFYFYQSTLNSEFQISWQDFEGGSLTQLSLAVDGNEVKMLDYRDVENSIYLLPHRGNEGEYAIGFDNSSKYLAFDKDGSAYLSKNATYFNLVADVTPIVTVADFYEEYSTAYSNDLPSGLEFGVAGNVFSLYSLDSGKYLNSYRELTEEEVNNPFFSVEANRFQEEGILEWSKNDDSNFFITRDRTSIDPVTIASYQTTAFDWSKITFGASEGGDDGDETTEPKLPSIETQYPLLTPVGNDLTLIQRESAYWSTVDSEGAYIGSLEDYPDAYIELIQNPSNLHEFALYFQSAGGYLSSENNEVSIKTFDFNNAPEDYSDYQELEYFRIEFSENKNPEYIRSSVSGITDSVAKLSVDTFKNSGNNLGFKANLVGIDEQSAWEFKTTDLPEIFNNIRPGDTTADVVKDIKRQIDSYGADYITEKLSLTGKNTTMQLNRLNPDYWYFGYVTLVRNEKKGVGNHQSSSPLFFKTAGSSDPVNWDDGGSVDIELPDAGNPTDSDKDEPTIISGLYESTGISNADSVNVSNEADTIHDIPQEELKNSTGTSIDVTLNLENGAISGGNSGVTTGIRVTLLDDKDNEVGAKEETTTDVVAGLESGDYTFRFDGLKPESEYTTKVEVRDIEDEWFTPLVGEDLDEMEPTTVDTERVIPTYTGGAFNEKIQVSGENKSVSLIYEDSTVFRNVDINDSVMFKLTAEGREYNTGWQTISKYESGVSVPSTGITISFQYYSLADAYHLDFTGLDNVDYQVKAYYYVGKGSDDLFEDEDLLGRNVWESSTIWTEDVNGLSASNVKTVDFMNGNFSAS